MSNSFYAPRRVGWFLSQYSVLAEGLLPGNGASDDWLLTLQKNHPRKMPGELASIVKADLDMALRKLGNQRWIPIIAYIMGWPDIEIGDMLGMSRHAVQMRRLRGRNRMAQILGYKNNTF